MKTVLVVEDSRAEQRLIVLLLQQSGLIVALAESAESALTWLAENERPDLIVLDIIMPGISGFNTVRLSSKTGRVRVVTQMY
ncbi:MAG: response regulator [Chroococcus sp. CMT-3BRIN-NPC107]|jgi:twitching motility two-component system response regulator PilH|nr:response regulator [Chroococcus sp. CMT-3BRIN-NPC107]